MKHMVSFTDVTKLGKFPLFLDKLKYTSILNCVMKKFMCFVTAQPAIINIATDCLHSCWKRFYHRSSTAISQREDR